MGKKRNNFPIRKGKEIFHIRTATIERILEKGSPMFDERGSKSKQNCGNEIFMQRARGIFVKIKDEKLIQFYRFLQVFLYTKFMFKNAIWTELPLSFPAILCHKQQLAPLHIITETKSLKNLFHSEFIEKDFFFFSTQSEAVLLLLAGKFLVGSDLKKRVRKTTNFPKSKLLPSFLFPPETCFPTRKLRAEKQKTDSWSYFKIVSCMKQEKENLSFSCSTFVSQRNKKSWINISNEAKGVENGMKTNSKSSPAISHNSFSCLR